MDPKEQYIAVFDSGVGGISVLRELMAQLPGEHFLYFGDSANAPYGVRSRQEVCDLTLSAAEYLMTQGIKALVVACNTATSAAIETLRSRYPDTVIIGIEPALKVAADRFPGGNIGILATPMTLREEKFAALLEKCGKSCRCTCIPAPGLAELVEQGKEDSEEAEALLRPLLEPLRGKLDALVLGCTHYPFAAGVIRRILGDRVALPDGSEGTARETRRRLEEAGLLRTGEEGSLRMENSAADPAILRRCFALLQKEGLEE